MNDNLTEKKSEYLLELALEERLRQDKDMNKYPLPESSSYVFSKEHEKRMKKIFKKAKRKEQQSITKRYHQKILVAAILVFCFCTITITQVEAFRIPIVRFFMEIKEKSTLISTTDNNDLNLSAFHEQYKPKFVPEGYVVVGVKENDNGFYIEYENEHTGDKYRYYFWDELEMLDIDSENGIVNEILIADHPATVIQKDDEIRIGLSIGKQRFYVNGKVLYDDAIKILESLF